MAKHIPVKQREAVRVLRAERLGGSRTDKLAFMYEPELRALVLGSRRQTHIQILRSAVPSASFDRAAELLQGETERAGRRLRILVTNPRSMREERAGEAYRMFLGLRQHAYRHFGVERRSMGKIPVFIFKEHGEMEGGLAGAAVWKKFGGLSEAVRFFRMKARASGG